MILTLLEQSHTSSQFLRPSSGARYNSARLKKSSQAGEDWRPFRWRREGNQSAVGAMNCVFGNRKAEGASLAGLKAQLRDIDRGRRGLVIKEVPNECADRKTSLAVDSIVDQM